MSPIFITYKCLNSIRTISPCSEDVGKLPNLIKYCVGLFFLLFLCSYRLGTYPLHLSLMVDFSLVVASRATGCLISSVSFASKCEGI